MRLKNFLKKEGVSAVDMAKAIGVTPAFISHINNGYRKPPPSRCAAIEQYTKGVVTRKDLRPDDWHLIWPELAGDDEKPS